MEKSIVLLSGGLDSSVNLALAHEKTDIVMALTIHYGQKAALKEIEAAHKLCAHFGVKHKVLEIPFLKKLAGSALLSGEEPPQPSVKDLDSLKAFETAEAVWVPNRNGLFINIAACYADEKKCRYIIVGFNKEEATTFADNSTAFIDAVNKSLQYSCQANVEVVCYTSAMNKKEIVALGREVDLPFGYIWSCYLGGETPCGTCESCLRLKRALGADKS